MIPLANPADSAFYTVEIEGLGDATISTATVTVPSPLVKVGSEAIDNEAVPPTVTVRISSAVHGTTYQILVTAVLDSGETIARAFPLVGFNG
jgi:hypothetical protein